MIERELLYYGYWFVAVGAVVEGDATLLTASFLAHRGYFSFTWVLVIAAASTSAASHGYYLLARLKGAELLEAVGLSNSKVNWVLAFSRRSGGLLILASRFMIGFRTLIPIVCGATGMGVVRFFFWNVVGAALWAAVFGAAGYLGGHLMSVLFDDVRRHEWLVAAILEMATAGYVLWRTHGRDVFDIWLLGRAFSRRAQG